MSSLFGIGAGSASTGFYPETIDQSVRFNDDDSPYLTRTPSSSSNRKTFTISFWFKLADLSAISYFYSIGTSSSNYFHARIQSNKLNFNSKVSGTIFLFTSDRVFRDTTNWYHIVFSLDSTQATASDLSLIHI